MFDFKDTVPPDRTSFGVLESLAPFVPEAGVMVIYSRGVKDGIPVVIVRLQREVDNQGLIAYVQETVWSLSAANKVIKSMQTMLPGLQSSGYGDLKSTA